MQPDRLHALALPLQFPKIQSNQNLHTLVSPERGQTRSDAKQALFFEKCLSVTSLYGETEITGKDLNAMWHFCGCYLQAQCVTR